MFLPCVYLFPMCFFPMVALSRVCLCPVYIPYVFPILVYASCRVCLFPYIYLPWVYPSPVSSYLSPICILLLQGPNRIHLRYMYFAVACTDYRRELKIIAVFLRGTLGLCI